jgi:serine O-acetyltransferase
MELAELKKSCSGDLHRFRGRSGFRSGCEAFLRYRGFRMVFLMRMAHFLRWHQFGKYISPLVIQMYYWAQTLYNTQISYGSEIGSGLYIPHTGGIVINPASKIGERCYLAHNVTIGKVHAGDKAGVPEVGDDVFLGVGAVILGKIKIGNNVAIGANSVVITDIPDNCFAAGSPAKVISNTGAKTILGLE